VYHQQNTIGIVEDDDELRETLGYLLKFYGYETEMYASATDFVGAVGNTQSSCLLVDINLERMSGLEMSRRLTDMGYTFPIVFMTGVADKAVHAAARKQGCVALLQKPFFPNELLDALANATKSTPS
jgi:FixJ family two-component response regulator